MRMCSSGAGTYGGLAITADALRRDVRAGLAHRRLADVVAGHPQSGEAGDDVGDGRRVAGAELDHALSPQCSCAR
jgi:hypothetical protein